MKYIDAKYNKVKLLVKQLTNVQGLSAHEVKTIYGKSKAELKTNIYNLIGKAVI